MAQAKRKTEWETGAQATVASADRALTAPVPSPARALQQLLEAQAAFGAEEARWSRRRSFAFIVAASASLWLALLAAAQGVMTTVV